jgi:membrane protease YdiL (CAAX protease family)
MLVRVGTRGGQVSAGEFGIADLLFCGAMMVWFGTAIVGGFNGPDKEVTQKDLVHGAVVFVAIITVIWIFMAYRGIRPWRQFGLTRRNVFLCAAIALGLVVCAYPLVAAAEQAWVMVVKGEAKPQNIVEFFVNASRGGDKSVVYITIGLAVVVAPVAEEMIFRGYIYGVLKGRVGGVAAAVVSALLFAGMHVNVGSLAPLFVLALCLTVAYEATGSLLVNIFMHGLFNLSMLLALMWAAGVHKALP